MKTVMETFEEWVQTQPDKALYTFLDINGQITEQYNYGDFENRVNIIASHLRARFNFRRNDKILLAFPPGIETICAFFACVKNGLIPVPTYPPTSSGFQSSYNKMVYIAMDCSAKAVLTSDEYYWNLKLNVAKNNIQENNILTKIPWINTGEFVDLASSNKPPNEEADFLFLQYTSGSTSEPKGVMVSHQNILHNSDLAVDHLPIGVTWLPQYHDMGLIGYYLFFALKGGTTYGFSSINFIKKPSLWLETITKYGGTASSAPNFAYDYCLLPGKLSPEVLENVDLSTLRYLMNAAEPVRTETYQRFLDFFKPYGLNPVSYFVAYGLAENTLAVSNYGRNSVSVASEALKRHILHILSPDSQLPSTKIMSCGKPLGSQKIRIVDPETQQDLGSDAIGEIWVCGDSKCLGYWNKEELSQLVFGAKIKNAYPADEDSYLRTGDLGFLHQQELYVCGRLKDAIIIRGLNYYPHDIEQIVEESSPNIRESFVAAFGIEDAGEEKLIVVAGLKNINKVPDPLPIHEAIQKYLNIHVSTIAFVNTKSIPKTSSGKIMRSKVKEIWLNGGFEVISEFSTIPDTEEGGLHYASPFDEIKRKYHLTGKENYSLAQVLDSLDLVCLIHDIEELLVKKGAVHLSKQVDTRLIQEINVSEFFNLVEELESASIVGIHRLKKIIDKLKSEHKVYEQKMMLSDCRINFKLTAPQYDPNHLQSGNILLTGGTGFLGPFLLKNLLQQTPDTIYVLIRAADEAAGKKKLIEGMEMSGIYDANLAELINTRVVAVPGDLSQKNMGLRPEVWKDLSKKIHTIYNNGAMVNYLFNYERMRETNVLGTNETIRFALEGNPKVLNHVSTTFVFGWAVKDILFETDFCENMDLLDFGYSQTKWVSEQLIVKAMEQGLKGRIFRPALITPSASGKGNNFDISIRLIAFMINHGISVNTHNQVSFTPVDVTANNIVAVSNMEDTIQKTFHMTRDNYSNMMDIMGIIQQCTGKPMQEFNLKQFVPEVVARCKKEDLLFPLLDFLVRSIDNISSMEFKLYNNDNYLNAKNKSAACLPDPSLEDTVKGMLLFMQNKGIIQTNWKPD
ncbi:MAG: thioester reductase domain-containing protein [Saprospiraceae bacterium]|nr:thioester reductase domain-containing protein [Saprospiraceae bacterium]